ncbi:hypothetical protein EV702DRAFT_1191636 [Suillus placidus]|uniref:DUF6830 domain-containing protein n=1 Tax=Suillus placidus TaxID=48579 RepID=A0A9P7A646_9AGAM|nr:hypothetical protein EV702DRAFT_1191636 [Suillus placidus]
MEDYPGLEDGNAIVEASDGEEVVLYVGAAKTWGRGTTFMKQFKSDKYTEERVNNPYFPFAGKPDWEMAAFILQLDLSMADIDEYLELEFLQGRAEMLPSPPQWKFQIVPTEFPTTKTLQIFYRDAIECLQSLLSHPMLAGSFDFITQKVYTEAAHVVCVYYGFMTDDRAWKLQEGLPDGATLLGVVLSSDKTKVSNLAGNRYAHPLLITLANIDPDFIHQVKHMHGVLADRLLHQCINIVIEPLKQAACLGIMMSDPAGLSRYCFMPLVAYVADTPEELIIACITMNASPVTMATHANFGDPDRHPLRKGSSTLAHIQKVVMSVSPSKIVAFFEAGKQYHLNSVQRPFWVDWVTADPSSFLMPESLHHFHKMFFDHDCAWCIDVVGAKEIDFCFSLLHMCTGYHTFKEGISNLKQTLGPDHCNIQHYIVGVIAGAAPSQFVMAIRTLLDFRYLAQAPQFSDETLTDVIDAGAWRGKDGGSKSWAIPKLELLQGVVPSIRSHGALMQWSADPTKHAHIAVVKVPARAGNNHDYDAQVCRYLDHHDKVDLFDLALHVREQEDIGDESDDKAINSKMVRRPIKDYFSHARQLINGDHPGAPHSYRTFSTSVAAYHLGYQPALINMTVDKAAIHFLLPDLRPAISNYLDRIEAPDDFCIGGRR